MAKTNRKFEEVKPDMTPMIDVTFLLLIFFIVTLKFKTLEGRLDAALPKDMGSAATKAEEIEKVDIVLYVANPGSMQPDPSTGSRSQPQGRLNHFVGRVIRYEVGTQSFTDLVALRQFLTRFDKDETPVTFDSRRDTVYGDVVAVLDVVVDMGFKKITFAGTFENE
ncbi:MAG TPA: biopolymer transporter ExbD [Planctomycetota bacterium]